MSWWSRFFGNCEQQKPQLPDLSYNEDPLYAAAAEHVIGSGNCSVSSLQRHLKIGYTRASDLIRALEADFIVSEMSGGARRLLSDDERRHLRSQPSKADQDKAHRISYLMEKYGDEGVVRMIMERRIWEGMSAAQLFDAIGNPEAVDQKYLKQASREVWKYDSRGGNRYGLRITLENGFVVGWDSKS
ncbi:DNA translocase FtsK [Pseudomonas sp. abacavir_1]